MATIVHSTAVIDPRARIGCGVSIGPFCLIEAGAVVGDDCRLAARVTVKEGTTLGEANKVDEGTVLGGWPQHACHQGEVGQLVIGAANTIRENVTIHCAWHRETAPTVGDHNFIMVNAHIAHDCRIGNHTIITNNVLLAGHVSVDDYAYLSGAVAVHQFCRIGSHCMVGGQAHVKKDVPPFVTVDGQSTRVVGLNLIGLRRRGFTPDEITQLKHAYRIIYRQGLTWSKVLEMLRSTFTSGPAAAFYPFLSDSRRGFIQERRTPTDATVPLPQLHVESDAAEAAAQRRVG